MSGELQGFGTPKIVIVRVSNRALAAMSMPRNGKAAGAIKAQPSAAPRRQRIIAVAFAVVLSSCSAVEPSHSMESARSQPAAPTFGARPSIAVVGNPILLENEQPGSSGWQLKQSGHRVSNDKTQQIKGFASAVSVNQGESLTFYVTVNPATTYAIDVYRIGWYGGMGGRLLHRIEGLNGVVQPQCPMDAGTGLLECTNWSPAYALAIPAEWTSGIYIAMLTNAAGYQDPVTFVVRDDDRTADLLFQQSVTTYQAYNQYPAGNGGKSLYPDRSGGANTVYGDARAVKVSFDRPYTSEDGPGDFFKWEVYMVRWLESNGYDVAYTTNIDTHAAGSRILNYEGFLSVGHDEYYSKEMYDALENARDHGVGLGFFGADEVNWQIRLEPSSTGMPNRVIICYKRAEIDPIGARSLKTVKWRSPAVSRPEQRLVGIEYNILSSADAPYRVINSSSWIYAGTGFVEGSEVPGIVHHEADTYLSSDPKPDNTSYTLVASSPFGGKTQNSVIYQAPSGAWVFGAGTIGWSWGLDDWNGMDLASAGIQMTTRNILERFISD